MKVALVQRGAPLEIVTNLHSKRKTENMVLFDSNTRFYGADANSLYGRKPQKTPSSMSVMLGRDDEHPTVKVLAERHYPITPSYNDTRSGVTLTVDGSIFTPEELVAMVLVHAKDFTTAYVDSLGKSIIPKDIVLTVPSFSTQHERKALMDAAALAEFNVLALLDENTAAALHYGMDKMMEEPKIYVFYNLGASSLQVSIVRFLTYPRKEGKFGKEQTVGALEVLAKSWDSTLGGLEFDHRIVEYLASEFMSKAPEGSTDVRTNKRAMAKLRLQATKVKQVLSANSEIPIYIDSLFQDRPLSSHLSRAKLEEVCHDLLERSTQPIAKALEMANLTLKDVDGIELIGGGMRIPRIQQEIQSYLGDTMELGLHINSDESMALGAAFHGANISTAFKVRHVGLADVSPFPIAIELKDLTPSSEGGDSEEEVWTKSATIFKSGSKVGVKKTIAFTHDKDVHCLLDYGESDILPEGTEHSLARYKVTGVDTFATEMEEKGLGKPKVSLQFELSSSGITELIKADATVEEITMVEEEVEVEDDEASNETEAAEGEETKKEETEEEKKEKDATDDDAEKKDGDEEEEAAPKKKKTKLVQKEKKKVHKRSLTVETYYEGRIQPYSEETMAESKAKLAEMARLDKERQLLEETRNKVESYIYMIKNKLVDDEKNVKKVTTEEQREELSKLAREAEDWMYEDGYDADLATFEAKYDEISTPAEKVWFRMKESKDRPAAIKALMEKMDKVEELMKKWESTMPQVTEDERGDVLEKVKKIREWIDEKEKEQDEKASHEDAAFTSDEVPIQSKSLETLVAKLSRKPKPKPPKKNETDANATSAEEDAENKTDAKTEEEETKTEEESGEKEEATKEEEGETLKEEPATGGEDEL